MKVSLPPLSQTLQTLTDRLPLDANVSAWDVLGLLQDMHPDYGGRWPDSPEGTMAIGETRAVGDWIADAASHFHQDRFEVFDGRMLVLGMALEAPEVAGQLAYDGFLHRVADEVLDPPLKAVMRDVDYERLRDIWRQVERTQQAQTKTDSTFGGSWETQTAESMGKDTPPPSTPAVPDSVPTLGDHPAHKDHLGRRAFARALAHRLIRVRDEDGWCEHRPPPRFVWPWFLWQRMRRRFGRRKPGDGQPSKQSGAFMLHIHGPWGAGKSTLLNFVRQELEELPSEQRWVSVYFNAWRYQRLGPPWWALSHEVYRQSLDCLLDSGLAVDRRRARLLRLYEWWWRAFNGWGGGFLLLGLALVAITAGMGFTAIPEYAKAWASLGKNLGQVAALFGAGLSAVRFLATGSARAADTLMQVSGDPMAPLVCRFDDMLKAVGRPVVIFIDDLDRCDADYIISLLHGIQTMYWNTQAAYVVAADRQWLRAAYENEYDTFGAYVGEQGRPIGYLFLEKLFQLSAAVPQVSPDSAGIYWQYLLGLGDVEFDREMAQARGKARAAMAGYRTEEAILGATQGHPDPADPLFKQALREEAVVRLASKEVEQSTEHALLPFLPLLEPNPRAMKRMVNAYGVRRAIDILRGGKVQRESLALWTIVEMRWPELAEHLAAHPEDVEAVRDSVFPGDREWPDEIRELMNNDDVKRVVRGEAPGIGASLSEASVRACLGTGEDDERAALMV